MKELLTLSGIGVFALLAEIFNFKKLVFPVIIIGLGLNIFFSITDWNATETMLFEMANFDHFTLSFNIVTSIITMLWFGLSYARLNETEPQIDKHALIVFCLVGVLTMVSFTNLSMLFLGIEILSVSLYVLAGSNKMNIRSNESAFKYFLMGAFASSFLLFGIALLYGMTGSFDIHQIHTTLLSGSVLAKNTIYMSILLLIVGMGFKVSVSPFHFWAPDVYQGAPTHITAFMATIVKIAAFGAFYRLFSTALISMESVWINIIGVMIVLTLIISNFSAVQQLNAKRLLAYSSISNAGFILMTFLGMKTGNYHALLYYSTAYALSSLVAFFVIDNISAANNGDSSIAAFQGLYHRNTGLAVIMTIALLSLSGIPPLSGFLAKYFVFAQNFQSGYYGYVLVGIVASLISVYYYFKIIIAMFTNSELDTTSLNINRTSQLLLAITCLLIIVLGLFPGLITDYL